MPKTKKSQLNLSVSPEIAELFRKMAAHKRLSYVEYLESLVTEDTADVSFCDHCGEILVDWRKIHITGDLTVTCSNCKKDNVFKEVNSQEP